jgi:hypothetical protein
MFRLRYLLLPCLLFLLSGCAHHMALSKDMTAVDLTKKPIALLSVRISNQNNPDCQFDLKGCFIGNEANKFSPVNFDMISPDEPYNTKDKAYKDFLLSFDVDPGTNNVVAFYANYDIFILAAMGVISIDLETNVKPNPAVYLGHLNIVLRKKTADTEQIGGLFPLIDAAIIGLSSGTFDVTVEDQYDEDMKAYVAQYPALQNVKVEKNILPPWIRPELRKTKVGSMTR